MLGDAAKGPFTSIASITNSTHSATTYFSRLTYLYISTLNKIVYQLLLNYNIILITKYQGTLIIIIF